MATPRHRAQRAVLGAAFFGLALVGTPVQLAAASPRVQVIDGDTFLYEGERIRMADIDAPETHPPRCAEEAELGARATERLRALLAAGPVALEAVDRDRDQYGRKLRIVTRDGVSLGAVLVAEGLARPYDGHKRPWCRKG
jgi:micrococcal nuclease